MSANRTLTLLLVLLITCFYSRQLSAGSDNSGLAGMWIMERERSTNIDPWRECVYDIREEGDRITLVKTLRSGRYFQQDSLTVVPDDQERETSITSGKWIERVHLGARVGLGSTRFVRARWEEGRQVLYIQSRITLETSQGDTPVIIESRFHLSLDGSTMALTEVRSTRAEGDPLLYDFSRVK
ncbi:MAG: hypothetical protein KAJ12_05925 [Bacteroidetes bacterium]|nr:hypothetical protein [Bacteroidota bacterium]